MVQQVPEWKYDQALWNPEKKQVEGTGHQKDNAQPCPNQFILNNINNVVWTAELSRI